MESYGEYTAKGIKKRVGIVDKAGPLETAYFLGYMACDGAYVQNKNWPFMSVNGTEKHVIERLQQTWCPDNTIYFVGKKSSDKVTAINDVWELRFPTILNELFNSKGIFTYKKNRRVVGIKQTALPAYIAGCIDADGFISVTFRKDTRTPRLRFFITHQSEKFLADLQNSLESFGVVTTLRQHGSNVFRLQAQNTEANKRFLFSIKTYLRNTKKVNVLDEYLNKYYVPQASDELLEP